MVSDGESSASAFDLVERVRVQLVRNAVLAQGACTAFPEPGRDRECFQSGLEKIEHGERFFLRARPPDIFSRAGRCEPAPRLTAGFRRAERDTLGAETVCSTADLMDFFRLRRVVIASAATALFTEQPGR